MNQDLSSPRSLPPQRSAPALWARALVLVLLFCLPLGAWWLWRFNPTEDSSHFIPCVFHQFTGLHCIGCGSTRAGHALLHGHLLEALAQNVFFVLAVPWLGWLLFTRTIPWIAGRCALARSANYLARWLIILPVALIAFAILRNLPFAPGPWLAPN